VFGGIVEELKERMRLCAYCKESCVVTQAKHDAYDALNRMRSSARIVAGTAHYRIGG
jgi:hypothetical protein